MTQKVRDKVCKVYDSIGNEERAATANELNWLCTTIEKLCDTVDEYKQGCILDEPVDWKAVKALKEWEDKL